MAAFNKILFILLVASLQQITTADVCPGAWIPWGSYCYRFELAHKRTWYNAESQCAQWGRRSHLASIHSAIEQEFILEVFMNKFRSCGAERGDWWEPTIYIGLYVGNTASDLSWSDGSSVNYLRWFRGEPNNFPHSAGQISAGSGLWGSWVDANTPHRHSDYFVCKMPQN